MNGFTPQSLEMLARLAVALAEPRNTSRWAAPDEVPISTPNGEPIGSLVWDSQQSAYRFLVASDQKEVK